MQQKVSYIIQSTAVQDILQRKWESTLQIKSEFRKHLRGL